MIYARTISSEFLFLRKLVKKKKKLKPKNFLSIFIENSLHTIPQREKPKSAAWGPFWGAEKKGGGGVAAGAWSRALFESVLVSVGGLEKVRRPFFGLSVLKKSSHAYISGKLKFTVHYCGIYCLDLKSIYSALYIK